jgi:hypothetical protein
MDPVLFAVLLCGGAALILVIGGWIVSKLGW